MLLLLWLLWQKKCEYHRTCCDYLVVAACQDCSAWNERKKLQHFYQLVVNMVWDLWKSYAHTFRCLALLQWQRTSGKGAMWAIVGRIFYCPLLNSKSPLICIVGKQQKDHKSRSLNYCFFANQGVLFFTMPFLHYKGSCAYGPFEDCQVRMFVNQRALPSGNVCDAGLIAKCECLWSSRTGTSSSYLLLKIKQFRSS